MLEQIADILADRLVRPRADILLILREAEDVKQALAVQQAAVFDPTSEPEDTKPKRGRKSKDEEE